jgi:hypothetical protein
MQDSPFSKSWHHAAAAPLPASGQNGIYRKNDTQLSSEEETGRLSGARNG